MSETGENHFSKQGPSHCNGELSKLVNGKPDRKWRKEFYRAEQLQGRVSAATSNKPKLGQEQRPQVVKQTQIGSKWSHIVEYTHCGNVAQYTL